MRVVGLVVIGLMFVPLSIYLFANGPTLSALALLSLPVFVAYLCLVLPSHERRWRRWGAVLPLAFLIFDVYFVTARLRRPPPSGVRYCENSDCQRRAPLLARLADEGETALAGLATCSALGLIHGREQAALDRLLRHDYARLETSPLLGGGPNAALIRGSADQTRALIWEPRGSEQLPGLVFLHGFGGQLTLYLQALIDSPLGERSIIVAPFLDTEGRWWTPGGEEVLRSMVERHLPARVDRNRVFLIGLSNGAVGAARLSQREELRRQLAGVILISGTAQPVADDLHGYRGLVISGRDDPRFSGSGVIQDVDAYRRRGADMTVRMIDGDHFIILSRQEEVTEAIDQWID